MPPKKSKKDKPSQAPSQPHKQPSSPKPNWPPLRPLIPSSDLTLVSLLEDQIYLIPNFFPSTLCKNYVSFLSSLPLTTTPGKPKKGDAVRVNDRFQIQDDAFAEMLWSETAMKELVTTRVFEELETQRSEMDVWGGKPLGLNANIRIYRYSKGQFFAQHYDDSNTLTFSAPGRSPQPAGPPGPCSSISPPALEARQSSIQSPPGPTVGRSRSLWLQRLAWRSCIAMGTAVCSTREWK